MTPTSSSGPPLAAKGDVYPDFVGIGAQKAGSTWLYRNLRAHPEIWMPPRKEIHYFNSKTSDRSGLLSGLFGKRREGHEWRGQVLHWTKVHGLEKPSLENLWWGIRYYTGNFDDGWYASLFEPGRGKVIGEITPAYSALDWNAVAHVHDIMPEAKIIFFMRNPIERLWSQLVMSFDRIEEGSADFVTDKRLLRRVERESYRLLTDYLRTLETWGEFYPEGRIFVGFLEDVSLFPAELLSRLYHFLGVDSSFRSPDLTEKVHSRSSGRVPVGVAAHLAETYREKIGRLSERFGGYADFWLYCAERLVNDPPTKEYLPYPLWESSLWEEWEGIKGISVQSGPLSSVRTAP